ncbi:MAG: DNA-binding protein WhiA [Acholeplasmataceae bacterium]
MSFAKSVKKEMTTIPVNQSEMLAEISAFFHLSCEIDEQNSKPVITYKSKNATVAIRFLKLLRSLYPSSVKLNIKDEKVLQYRKSINLKILSPIDEIISEHGLGQKEDNRELLLSTPETKQAYLRAAFLIGGSVNDPSTSNYHLEIFAKKTDDIVLIQSIMNYFNLNAKIIKRRNGFIAYLKDSEQISNFLILTKAQNSLFKFEDVRIQRDFNNSINRIINMEVANEQKVIASSSRQVDDINYIKRHLTLNVLNPKLKEVALLRLENPTLSLSELQDAYFEKYNRKISRSGLNHRFIKIREIRLEDEERGKI